MSDTHSTSSRGRILIVAANPSVSPVTGWPVGFWAAELTHPWWTFREAGYEVDIASPDGGAIVPDGFSDPRDSSGYSRHDILSLGFLESPVTAPLLAGTLALDSVDLASYAAVFFVGGQAPMVSWREDGRVRTFLERAYATGRPVGVVCHASCLLLAAKGPGGKLLVEGKRWTGFADAEEQLAEQAVGTKIQPFWIETEARKIAGTEFVTGAPFAPFAVVSGSLVTGQQQNSGAEAARRVLELLATAG